MHWHGNKIIEHLIAWLELSDTIPILKHRLFIGMALFGSFGLLIDLLLSAALGFDWLINTFNVLMLLFLSWMAWRLWRRRNRQELSLLILFFGSTTYLLVMMSYSTWRLPLEIIHASILRAMAPWFLWFMLLNIGCFLTFRARTALRISLVITSLLTGIVVLIVARATPNPLIALHDFFVLLFSNVLVIVLAFPLAQSQERDSHIDFLTRLPNRMRGFQELVKEIERAERYGIIFTIILFDIDHFKQINDRFGHPTGDAVLREVANFINQHIRATDLLCRWGGEEFLILLPHNDLASGRLKAEHLRSQIKNRAFHHDIRITASFGVTTHYPRDSTSTILERADAALYRAKANGRNCVETE
ncbi:MAG: GGDEF domain-containing protein [Chloroflexi bacterium]|nr:GGDEF domain-containing protein [Chloroflexota bacterium]